MNEFEWLLTILEDEIAKVETEKEVVMRFWELMYMHKELMDTHQEWGERLTKIRNRLQQWSDEL